MNPYTTSTYEIIKSGLEKEISDLEDAINRNKQSADGFQEEANEILDHNLDGYKSCVHWIKFYQEKEQWCRVELFKKQIELRKHLS